MFDAIIIGAGLNGSIAALALAQTGCKIAVLEAKPAASHQHDGRTTAISFGNSQFLQSLGVWDDISPHSTAIADILITDQNSPVTCHFSAAEKNFPAMGYIVDNAVMRRIFAEKLNAYINVRCIEDCRVTNIDTSAGNLQTTQGVFRGQIIIAADGKISAAAALAGIAFKYFTYNQSAVVCMIAHEKPHQNIAYERFLASGPLALLPARGNTSSLVWTESPTNAQTLATCPENLFCHALEQQFGNSLGTLSILGKRWLFPLEARHAKQYTQGRLLLLGDAAHSIHPIAGQGLNLGIRDTKCLTEILEAQARVGLDFGSSAVMQLYETRRRLDNTTMVFATDSLNRLFHHPHPVVKAARRFGLSVVARTPALKNAFMLQAMGIRL